MSAVRTGLPTSLTPQVLEEILRYEPRHWKAIKTRLARKRATLWKDMSLSDERFYDKLHELLKDSDNRHDFDVAAKSRSSKNRAGGLFRGIVKHYLDQLVHEDSFRERMPAKATSRELIDAVSYHDDDDRLANVIWALLEDDALHDDEFSEVAAEHPGVSERFQTVVDEETTREQAAPNQWEAGLARLREALDSADLQRPNSTLVEQLAERVNELRELASTAEAERSAAFSLSLLELMRQHAAVLSDRPSLKHYVDRVEHTPLEIEPPEEAAEVLKEFDRMLRSLDEAVGRFREKSAEALEADATARGKLLAEINQLHAAETDQFSKVEGLFLQLFGKTNPGAVAETAQPPVAPGFASASERDTDGDESRNKADDLNRSADVVRTDDAATVRRPETAAGAKTQPSANDELEDSNQPSSASDEASKHIPPADDISSLTDDECTQAGSAQTGTTSVSRPAEENDATPDTSDLATAPADDPPVCVESSAPDERHSRSVALGAFNGMLSSRRFARAYWLTRADHTLGDPDLFGALSEGARIGPGDSCPGALVHFFNRLAQRDRWQDDERLLLGASVLGACLFVDPLPQDIYQLAGELPVDGSPVGRLMQRVRELCVFQNAKIRPEDLGVESADVARTARLDHLKNEADQFLKRVPHIRFQYAPADFAVQYLYRAGSEWHRLHTIVIDDRVSRLNEARSLVKLLDPNEVVGTLHQDAELAVLKQPLDGRARDKLTRHLHDTLALAREWFRLAATAEDGDRGGDRTQSTELLSALQRSLPTARRALAPARGRGAEDALNCVLEDLEARLQGREPKQVDSISGDLRLLPGLVLEDDFEPAERDLDDLRCAILEAEHSEPKPESILSECLSRREYRRARDIIEFCQLGERARTDYQHAISRECSDLETALRELELEIEDAFLLGQLRDEAEEDESADDQTRNALERSQLLGVVRDSRRKLNQSDDSASDELRAISLTVDDVADKVDKMTSRRQDRLRREFDVVMKQLPDTEQGKADQHYLRAAFDGCVNGNDHVAAFDLLDRGRRAAQGPDPVARASTGSSEDLEQFLKRADGYRDALSKRDWLRRLEGSIRKGSTFADIAFGQLDRNRRDEAASAVRTWHSLTQLRFSSAHPALKDSLEELLHFIGLPLREGGVQVVDTTQPGFAHVRVTLSRPVTSSPLPAFGSACGRRYEVVISQTRKEPEQFAEYIRGRSLEGSSVP